jgi:hypothetical protein
MVRLNAHPEKYHGIRVENCGLLFLGTPHSGTVQADWNDFVAGIAVLFGVRFDVVDSLRSFNGFSVESKEAFGSLPQQPPYFCLCETRSQKLTVYCSDCNEGFRRAQWSGGISNA